MASFIPDLTFWGSCIELLQFQPVIKNAKLSPALFISQCEIVKDAKLHICKLIVSIYRAPPRGWSIYNANVWWRLIVTKIPQFAKKMTRGNLLEKCLLCYHSDFELFGRNFHLDCLLFVAASHFNNIWFYLLSPLRKKLLLT